MSSTLTLVLGGARSGKSRYAQSLLIARERVVFIATARPDDPEMASRILRHRKDRPPHFETVESSLDVVAAVASVERKGVAILVDCVTLWLSNLLYQHRDLDRKAREARIMGELESLVETSREREIVLVSNEVGGGIVPDSSVAREFRDLQGRGNQILGSAASRVVLMVAGIPLAVK